MGFLTDSSRFIVDSLRIVRRFLFDYLLDNIRNALQGLYISLVDPWEALQGTFETIGRRLKLVLLWVPSEFFAESLETSRKVLV